MSRQEDILNDADGCGGVFFGTAFAVIAAVSFAAVAVDWILNLLGVDFQLWAWFAETMTKLIFR